MEVVMCMQCKQPLREMPGFLAGHARVRCLGCQEEAPGLSREEFAAREKALSGKGKGRPKKES
jgi:hypothetical protein